MKKIFIPLTIVICLASGALLSETNEQLSRSYTYNQKQTQVGNLISVEVFDRDGNTPLPVYIKNGKHYIAGEKGHEYQINLYNRAYKNNMLPYQQRKMAIVSVDGSNVISGEKAGFNQSGYVLNAGDFAAIKGWRKNMDEIAKFYFTYPEESYAAKTGNPANNGVIGIAVFNERYIPPPTPDIEISKSGRALERNVASAPAAKALADAKSELGTGHGDRERSSTRKTEFEKESNRPNEIVTIYYDTYANLVDRGIIQKTYKHEPNPFPQSEMKFAPDPR